MTGRALLDLNLPAFQDELFSLDAGEYRQIARTLRKLRAMTWNEIYRDHGLKWEAVKSMPGKYTLRLSRQSRAVARRDGDYLRFQAIHTDHDAAYGRK